MAHDDLPPDLRLAALRYLNKTPTDQRVLHPADLSRWFPNRPLSDGEIALLLSFLADHKVDFIAD